MKTYNSRIYLIIFTLIFASVACRAEFNPSTVDNSSPTDELSDPSYTPTPLLQSPVTPGTENPDEPTAIYGDIPYTSPFFLDSTSEPFVMLEDEAGFVFRDRNFEFPTASQALGPVIIDDNLQLSYNLTLPSVPQGTFVDVDNNGEPDQGIQIFAIAYWDNTWGGPFLEERDGTGWSTAYTSAVVDPNNDDEIQGGVLIVWSPDDLQGFPSGYGADGLLFTDDDPTSPISAGYNFVDLDAEPFKFYKEARTKIDLLEGVVEVNDYSNLAYQEAFDAFFEKASREYPFTQEKNIDWQSIYNEFLPRFDQVKNDQDFYRLMHEFSLSIPDGHVGLDIDPQVFYEEQGGGIGLVLAELSDGQVIVTSVIPDSPADKAGIQHEAVISSWNGVPIDQAIEGIVPQFHPYSTEHAKRPDQVIFLTRTPPGTRVRLTYQNPGETSESEAELRSVGEYDSLFEALDYFEGSLLPVEGRILEPSGLGYIRINSFGGDYHLMAQIWESYIEQFMEFGVPGIIIDIRNNPGGNFSLARDFAGYFFDQEVDISRRSYFNENTGSFEYDDTPESVKPAPIFFSGPIAIIIGPDSVSTSEGFAYTLQQNGRTTIIGHTLSAGAYGEVRRGQYILPGSLSMQFPTGRSETMDGKLMIEGTGISPDVQVPITKESALGELDALLEAAIEALLGILQ